MTEQASIPVAVYDMTNHVSDFTTEVMNQYAMMIWRRSLTNGNWLHSIIFGKRSLKPDFTFVSYGARLRVAYLNGVCYKWLPHCDSKGIGLSYYKARLAQITNE